jgi:hypothetical protein
MQHPFEWQMRRPFLRLGNRKRFAVLARIEPEQSKRLSDGDSQHCELEIRL